MIVIPPVAITDTALATRSSIAEPDATAAGDGVGATEWASGTTYAADALVTRGVGFTHRVYKSGAGSNLGNVPENTLATTPAKWVDVGPTNRWRMLRANANYRSSGASPLTVTLSPGVRVSALAIVGMGADSVTVQQKDSGGNVTYTYTKNLRLRNTLDWSDYFFGAFRFQTAILLLDIPLISSSSLTVTLTRASGAVTCGPIVYGTSVNLGPPALGATAGITDYSVISRDTFGNSTLLQRKSIPLTTQTTTVLATNVDLVRDTLTGLRATAAMYAGIEDSSSAFFNSLAVLGIVNRWGLTVDRNEVVHLSLDIEGL